MVYKVLDVSGGGGSESHPRNCTLRPAPLPPKNLVAPVLRTTSLRSGREGGQAILAFPRRPWVTFQTLLTAVF